MVEVDSGPLVGGEAGQQRCIAAQPAMAPAAHLQSQARQRPMWPSQALRLASPPPWEEASPLQAGLHPGVAQLDPLFAVTSRLNALGGTHRTGCLATLLGPGYSLATQQPCG
jgi:hypothetical protein